MNTNLTLIIGIVLLAFLAGGCRDKDDPGLIDLDYRIEFDFQAGLTAAFAHYVDIPNQDNYIEDAMALQGITWSDVSNVRAYQGSLESIFGDVSFDFLREIEVFLVDAKGIEYSVYYRDPVPDNVGNRVDLVANLADVKSLLQEDKLHWRIRYEVWSVVPSTIEARMQLIMRVY